MPRGLGMPYCTARSREMLAGPMALLVLLLVGLVLVVGALLLRGGEAEPPAGRTCPNKDCRRPNPPGARYCGHCGRALRD